MSQKFRNGRWVHRFILCKNLWCSRWFCTPPPLFWGCVLLYLRSPKGGYCSISDDLSCSFVMYISTTAALCISKCTFGMTYKKRLLPRCIHHFKSDLINNMDHMRIWGTEPSSVILSQKRSLNPMLKTARSLLMHTWAR